MLSKKTNGFLLLAGLAIIFLFNLVSNQPILNSFLLVLGLVLAIVFLANPKWGLFLIIFLRPSIDRFSENITLSLNENLTFNAGAMLGILVVGLLSFFILKNFGSFRKLPASFLWLIFLLISLLSFFFSIEKSSSLYEIIRLVSILLVFASFFLLAQKEKNPSLILWAIVSSAVVPFLFATYQLATGTGLGGTSGIESRLFGTFSHPNPFASFIVIVLVAALFLVIWEKNRSRQIFLAGLTFWGLILLIETFSRGAWFAFLIFILILILKKSPKLILLAAGLVLVLYFSFPLVQERIEDIYNPPADSSVRWRFAQWERMYQIFLKNPAIGQGIGTETIAHEQEYGPYAGNPYTHNDFLRVALETGIPGLLAYFFLIMVALKNSFTTYLKTQNKYLKDFHLFVLALFLALISFSLTNNTLRETVTQWTLWALLGTSFALTKRESLKNSHEKSY